MRQSFREIGTFRRMPLQFPILMIALGVASIPIAWLTTWNVIVVQCHHDEEKPSRCAVEQQHGFSRGKRVILDRVTAIEPVERGSGDDAVTVLQIESASGTWTSDGAVAQSDASEAAALFRAHRQTALASDMSHRLHNHLGLLLGFVFGVPAVFFAFAWFGAGRGRLAVGDGELVVIDGPPGLRKSRKRHRLDSIRGIEIESGEGTWNLTLKLEGNSAVIASGTKDEMTELVVAIKQELAGMRKDAQPSPT